MSSTVETAYLPTATTQDDALILEILMQTPETAEFDARRDAFYIIYVPDS